MGVKSDYNGIMILELFPHCNYHCDFCFQSSSKKTNHFLNNDKLFEKSRIYYLNLFLMKYESYNIENIDFCNIWGGELFYDNTPEYNKLLMKLIYTINPQKKLGVITNLSNINPCLHSLLFDKHPFDMELTVSFDAVGRFHTKEMLDTYLKNIEIVKTAPNIKKSGLVISTVLTSEMLDDKYDFTIFDKLYSTKDVHISLLLDYSGYPDYILNNFGERILKLFKKYPLLDNARNFLVFTNVVKDDQILPYNGNNVDRYCYCERDDTYYFSYVTKFDMTDDACSSCKKGDYKLIEESWGCKDCKYNNICSDICPGSSINSGIIKLKNNCPYRYMYDHIDELKDEYIKKVL